MNQISYVFLETYEKTPRTPLCSSPIALLLCYCSSVLKAFSNKITVDLTLFKQTKIIFYAKGYSKKDLLKESLYIIYLCALIFFWNISNLNIVKLKKRTWILNINNFEFFVALIYYMIVPHCLVKTQYFTLGKEKLNYLHFLFTWNHKRLQ